MSLSVFLPILMWLFVFTASLPPNMGDSILASLSLPPSGRASSRRPADSTEARNTTAFTAPVIGLLSNDDVPILANKKRRDEDTTENDEASKRRCSVKRQQPERSESEVEEGEEMTGKKRMKTTEAAGNPQKVHKTPLGLCLPEDPALCSVFMSCLNNQPRVMVEKVAVSSPCAPGTPRAGRSFYGEANQGRKLQVKAPKRRGERTQKADSDYLGLNDKE